jgi:hypothetical protein
LKSLVHHPQTGHAFIPRYVQNSNAFRKGLSDCLIFLVCRRGLELPTYGLKDECPAESDIPETPSKSDNNQESQIDRPEPEVGPSEVE